jgi:hypothetical protein
MMMRFNGYDPHMNKVMEVELVKEQPRLVAAAVGYDDMDDEVLVLLEV